MLRFLKDRTCSAVPVLRNIAGLCPVGVDMSNDSVTMAQLADNGHGIDLVSGVCKKCPPYIKPGSVDWQKWAIDRVREVTSSSRFRGKEVIAALPPADLFLDYIRIPKIEAKGNSKEAKASINSVLTPLKKKLGFNRLFNRRGCYLTELISIFFSNYDI